MFDQIVEPRISKLRRYSVFLSICYFGLAAFNLFDYRATHNSDHVMTGVVWLVAGMVWGYRFRHVGEPQIVKLHLSLPEEPNDDQP
jgi:hypothetical protein